MDRQTCDRTTDEARRTAELLGLTRLPPFHAPLSFARLVSHDPASTSTQNLPTRASTLARSSRGCQSSSSTSSRPTSTMSSFAVGPTTKQQVCNRTCYGRNASRDTGAALTQFADRLSALPAGKAGVSSKAQCGSAEARELDQEPLQGSSQRCLLRAAQAQSKLPAATGAGGSARGALEPKRDELSKAAYRALISLACRSSTRTRRAPTTQVPAAHDHPLRQARPRAPPQDPVRAQSHPTRISTDLSRR